MEVLYTTGRLLLTIVEKKKIADFLILNESKFVLLRAQADEQGKAEIEKLLIDLVAQSQGKFARVAVENWSPEDDARDRILSAARQLGIQLQNGKAWRIAGREPLNRLWVPAADEQLDTKTKEFAIFMTKVLGQFTKAYLNQMPRRTDDRWLLSVMIHLVMNSISVNNYEEDEIRSFPYV
jgi:hypothetical protein